MSSCRTCAVVVGKAASRRKRIHNIYVAFEVEAVTVPSSTQIDRSLNAELVKKALEKVGNPNVLVNLISRRVRQLTSGAGKMGRPLVADTGHLGAADIALLEIIEDKMGFELPELAELSRPAGRKRKKH